MAQHPSLPSRRRSALRATRITYAILQDRATTADHIAGSPNTPTSTGPWTRRTPVTARLGAAIIALLECEGRVKSWEEEHRRERRNAARPRRAERR